MRNPIRPLAPETINRIAAGEVVESPSSVLKELIENALDAGATRIELEIAGGGINLLKLGDDGHGIPREELPEALERHSTSKITGLDDIERNATLGFRGEALAAIASVSLLEICSRVESDESAWTIVSRGGAVEPAKPAARAAGTTVTVRELFGDVPARRKFLRSEAGEKRRLLALWHTYVLAWPELTFVFREEGRELSHYPAAAALRERARQILGDTTARHMVEVDLEFEGYRLTGLASLPLISRGNRSHQFLYLGRRPIKDGGAGHAISQAYSDMLVPGRFPAVILFLETPPGMVDVNVHPAKREVRFRDARRIHHVVSRGLKKAIHGEGDLGRLLEKDSELLLGRQRTDAAPARPTPDAPSQEEIFGRPVVGDRATAAPGGRPRRAGGGYGGDQLNTRVGGSGIFMSLGESGGHATPSDAPAPERTAEPRPERLFWQLHNTFILTQIRGGLVIIDQHNAHERVLYDAARAALAGERMGSQRLLFPHTVELDADEMEAWREQTTLFSDLGFLIEEFGDRTLSVVGIPDNLRRWDDGRVIRDILDDVIAETGGLTAKRDRALMSFACKSAIKAGEDMRDEEMRHLVDQLFGTSNPYTCPHGRPIVIRISMDELEKRFHRTVPEGA